MKSLCAFVNGNKGLLLVGVHDDWELESHAIDGFKYQLTHRHRKLGQSVKGLLCRGNDTRVRLAKHGV